MPGFPSDLNLFCDLFYFFFGQLIFFVEKDSRNDKSRDRDQCHRHTQSDYGVLHGNNGLSRVEGDGTGKILVIKDSYANSFVPYLTANYGAIDVVDFRNYNYGLDQLIADNDYDAILVLYSYSSFTSDPYLYRAGVAG